MNKYCLITFNVLFTLLKVFFLLIIVCGTIADRSVVENPFLEMLLATIYATVILLSIFLPKKYKKAGIHQNELYREALYKTTGLEHHDIGFLYSLSAVAGDCTLPACDGLPACAV